MLLVTLGLRPSLQASPGAFAAARELGLVNPDNSNSVGYLLSDQYLVSDHSTSEIAKGVGITLHDRNGEQRRFVGQPGLVGTGYPRGTDAGWYPVGDSMGAETCATAKLRCYRLDFTARLVHLPGRDITPGKVRAIAHVLVKVQ